MSQSRFKRARSAPSVNDPWATRIQRDAHALESSCSPAQLSPLAPFFDEPTVELDATVLSGMLAQTTDEALEETRTFQIPAEVLALARGDQTPAAGAIVARARPGLMRGVPFARLLVTAWAIALGYFLVQIIDG
jgi:hypothetical protein